MTAATDSPDHVVESHKQKNEATIQAFKRDLQKVRTGRASAGIIENLQVEYYGAKTPLSHLCQISSPEPRLLTLQVYDSSAAQPIEKAIQSAGLGLNPSREGNSIRVFFPALTEESRKELVKALQRLTEDMRVSVRNHRRDANDVLKKFEKEGHVSKDDVKKAQDKIQQFTDNAIKEIDKLLHAKEAEVMEV